MPIEQATRDLVTDLLALVQKTSGFGLVMLTRVVGEDWRVLEVTDNPYGVVAGDTFKWQDSICARMDARNEATPWSLPVVDDDPDANRAPVRNVAEIASYAGVPLRTDDGVLLGTLCAIDPSGDATREVNDLLLFAQRFASIVLDAEAARAMRERAAERVLLAGDRSGPTVIPRMSWQKLLASETTRTAWSGERLTVVLARLSDAGDGRPMPIARLAEQLAAVLGDSDAVAVLGSNRVGILAIDRPWSDLEAAIDDVADGLEPDSVVVQSAGAEVVGPATAADVCAELESALVGAPAATARSASQQLIYGFCDDCGRKGRYQRPGTNLMRCKYCGAQGTG